MPESEGQAPEPPVAGSEGGTAAWFREFLDTGMANPRDLSPRWAQSFESGLPPGPGLDQLVEWSGTYQMGEDHARSWMTVGRSGFGSTPARTASQVDQRQVGFSRTRT